jgi:acetylornithine deacetylase
MAWRAIPESMMHPSLETAVDLLDTLVTFDTRSSESNLPLIEFVRSYLSRFGVESKLTYDASGNKANLYATLGNHECGGICLSGHTDVVPVAGQPWTVPPFALTRTHDRVLGRGTADMKGFLACVLASVPYLLEQRGRLPVHLAFSYDEEVGCLGVRGLLRELDMARVKPLACIIGEPTNMQTAVAHKGKRAYRCCVRGLAGHSALPHLGVNAVDFAAELVVHLRSQGRQLREAGVQDALFEPPYSTLHTGRLVGGTAVNVIPDRAEIDFEMRHLPNDDPTSLLAEIRSFTDKELVAEMQVLQPESRIDWTELTSYPGLADQPAARWLAEMVCDLTGDRTLRTLSFGSEGGLFQAIGIPTVVCGPGSIEQGHKADEYVTLKQLSHCLHFVQTLGDRARDGRIGGHEQ